MNAPRAKPNNSVWKKASVMAAQLTSISGPPRRGPLKWIARAIRRVHAFTAASPPDEPLRCRPGITCCTIRA